LSGDRNHSRYNRILEEQYHKAQTILWTHYDRPLSTREFIEKFRDCHYGNTDFYVFIGNELKLQESTRAKQTLSNYYNLINKMKEWKPTLTFNEITLEYIQRFHDHELKTGNILSTIYKKHANFKFLLGLALSKEQIQKNPYDKFPIKKITKAQNNDILTEDELKILQEAYDSNRYTGGKREVLRDFLFSCYTSLSYAEFHHVTFGDLKPVTVKVNDRDETYPLLCNDRQKTAVIFRTIAAKKGIRDSIAERIMGHAEGNDIQNIYMHLSDEDIVREMLDKWVVKSILT
jgi:integrase